MITSWLHLIIFISGVVFTAIVETIAFRIFVHIFEKNNEEKKFFERK